MRDRFIVGDNSWILEGDHFMSNTALGLAAISVAAGIALSGAALADEAGEAEYAANCATCHGAAGMGNGPLAEYMSIEVPDLTTIAQRNDGEFPFLEVIHIVDGRTGLRGHGSNMPVWGDNFSFRPDAMEGDYSTVLETRGRIVSIVYYIESIQK